jgi:chemotaxis protein CheD
VSPLLATAREVPVRIADLAVATAPASLTTTGLGSCVAIVLHDASCGVGGLAHVLLPSPVTRATAPLAKFVSTAVPELVNRMRELGARDTITARLVGGARMFSALLPADQVAVGDRNVLAAREALSRVGVPVVGEDTGGEFGRSVTLDVASGVVMVRSFARAELTL